MIRRKATANQLKYLYSLEQRLLTQGHEEAAQTIRKRRNKVKGLSFDEAGAIIKKARKLLGSL